MKRRGGWTRRGAPRGAVAASAGIRAAQAATDLLPTSPHTCGGPLLHICSTHLCTAVPNFLIMESNYWNYTHQFPYFVTHAPVPGPGSSRSCSPAATPSWKP
jgi:L-alanine-DL-glutamate epimerase-like enolase superfamily enzyme